MKTYNRAGRVLSVALAGLTLGACEFIEPVEGDPNAVPTASIDQLFISVQLNTYLFTEGQLSRLSAMWTQQMTGVDRQFAALDIYTLTEGDSDDEFSTVYTGGGLVDIRKAIALAEAAGRNPYVGILKIHEAYLIGMAASMWGDIPYREAVNADIDTPALDGQAQVYADVQALLSEAITDLAGTGSGPGASDLWFQGNAAKWTAVAHTLKARFFMHWAEVSAGNYGLALGEANQGIAASSGTWRAQHSSASTENNLWYQFMRDRSGYIGGGDYLGPQMVADADPRLDLYFEPLASGHKFTTAVRDGLGDPGFGAANFDFPMVSCAENQWIKAEATLGSGGTEANAKNAAVAALDCDEAEHGLSSTALAARQTAINGLTGTALKNEILRQKYVSMFLNPEALNDYKRTCRPGFTPRAGGVPRRLFYGQSERQANENIPAPSAQPKANANDPNAC